MNNSKIGNRAVIVPASAGSGKTYRIAHEYIYDVLRNRYNDEGEAYFDHSFYKRILAVTFTNKATEEMKSRILKEIHLLASGQESGHLADLIKETSLDEATLRRRAQIVRSLILHDYSHFTGAVSNSVEKFMSIPNSRTKARKMRWKKVSFVSTVKWE